MSLRYAEQLQEPRREFDAQMETASYRKLKDWRNLLFQYLLQLNISLAGEDKSISNESELKKCGGMPLLTDLALMMRIDPLALRFVSRELVTVVYGPTVAHVSPDVQVEAYRHSVLYVNLVSVVSGGLFCAEQGGAEGVERTGERRSTIRKGIRAWLGVDRSEQQLQVSNGRRKIFDCTFQSQTLELMTNHQGYEKRSENTALAGDIRPCEGDSSQWLAGLKPLPDRCPLYLRIRRMLLGVTSPVLAPRIEAAQDVEESMLKWSEGMKPRFISWNAAVLHTFEFTFPDIWSRKKIKAIPSRKPEVSAGHWNDVYIPADAKAEIVQPRDGSDDGGEKGVKRRHLSYDRESGAAWSRARRNCHK